MTCHSRPRLGRVSANPLLLGFGPRGREGGRLYIKADGRADAAADGAVSKRRVGPGHALARLHQLLALSVGLSAAGSVARREQCNSLPHQVSHGALLLSVWPRHTTADTHLWRSCGGEGRRRDQNGRRASGLVILHAGPRSGARRRGRACTTPGRCSAPARLTRGHGSPCGLMWARSWSMTHLLAVARALAGLGPGVAARGLIIAYAK